MIDSDFAFDIESITPSPHSNIVGIGISTEHDDHYIPLISFREEPIYSTLADHKTLFTSPHKKIAHNMSFDGSILKYHGIDITNPQCTQVLSWMTNETLTHNLPDVSQRVLGYRVKSFKEFCPKGWYKTKPSVEEVREYCLQHSRAAYEIYKKLRPEVDDLYDQEMEVVNYVISMMSNGTAIDVDRLLELKAMYEQKMKGIDKKIYALGGEFNINSSQQLGKVLHEDMGYPVLKRTPKKQQPVTDEKVLKQLPGKFPKLVLQHKEYKKLSSTYTDSLFDEIHQGRIHTSFNPVGTRTGRLSSSNPNLQNIPIRKHPELRGIFIASPNHILIGADYNQVELRVLAHFCQDSGLLNAVTSGEDIHIATAKMMFNDYNTYPSRRRYQAKTINFALIYGMSANSLAIALGIYPSEAKALMQRYFQEFPTLKDWMSQVIEQAKNDGYITLLSGERRHFPEYEYGISNNKTNRMVINYLIQGSAADICKKAMTTISHPNLKPLLQVHDELIFEAEESKLDNLPNYVKIKMEQAEKLSVPLLVDVKTGYSWEELK